MSKYELKFTLEQHTPIIHFQSEQSGATLRATELKPKLDRFLIEQFEKERIDYTDFLISGQERALDYKVKIEAKGKNHIGIPKAYVNSRKETDLSVYQAPYFSDSLTVFTDEKINVTIKSFNSELVKKIEKYIDYIFIFENFGTRQSKGFGSFLREDISDNEINKILSNHQNEVFLLGNYGDYKQAFLTIDSFYKELKMGINKPYKKSLLFKYMCSKHNIGWEKKFLKNKFPQIIHGTHTPAVCTEPDDREFKYIRAVLGLAEHNEFRPKDGKKQVKIKSVKKDEKDNKKAFYQRFKSPITFKVFNNNIYVVYNKSYEDILNEEFSFYLNREEKLFTPKEFDMYDFLKFVEKETNLKEVKR